MTVDEWWTSAPRLLVYILVPLVLVLAFRLGGFSDETPPVAEASEPVVSPRVTVEVLYHKRPEVAIITVDGVRYITVNYLVGGAGITPMVVPE